MLMPAGTLSIGSSLPPTGDIRTSATGAGAAATAGGGAGAEGCGGSALAAAGDRARLALGAMTSIFGKVGAVGAVAGVSAGGAAFGAPAGGAAGFFFGAMTSSCGRGGAVGAGVSGACAGGSAAGGGPLGDGTWLKATSTRTTQPTITAMPHRKIHIRPPDRFAQQILCNAGLLLALPAKQCRMPSRGQGSAPAAGCQPHDLSATCGATAPAVVLSTTHSLAPPRCCYPLVGAGSKICPR